MVSIKDIMMFSMSNKYMLNIVWKNKFKISDKNTGTIILKLIRKKKMKHLNWITRQSTLGFDKQFIIPMVLTSTNSLGVIKTVAQNIDYKSTIDAQIILWMREHYEDTPSIMETFNIIKKDKNINIKLLVLIKSIFINRRYTIPFTYRDTKRIARELSLPLSRKITIQSCS